MVLICIFLMNSYVEHPFMYLLVICMSSLGKCHFWVCNKNHYFEGISLTPIFTATWLINKKWKHLCFNRWKDKGNIYIKHIYILYICHKKEAILPFVTPCMELKSIMLSGKKSECRKTNAYGLLLSCAI